MKIQPTRVVTPGKQTTIFKRKTIPMTFKE
jgi:hypothetical protein